mgnify:CR=1 FL=1
MERNYPDDAETFVVVGGPVSVPLNAEDVDADAVPDDAEVKSRASGRVARFRESEGIPSELLPERLWRGKSDKLVAVDASGVPLNRASLRPSEYENTKTDAERAVEAHREGSA